MTAQMHYERAGTGRLERKKTELAACKTLASKRKAPIYMRVRGGVSYDSSSRLGPAAPRTQVAPQFLIVERRPQ